MIHTPYVKYNALVRYIVDGEQSGDFVVVLHGA